MDASNVFLRNELTATSTRCPNCDNRINECICTTSGSRYFYFEPSEPVKIQVSIPKKNIVLRLKEEKTKKQLKAWGLRK